VVPYTFEDWLAIASEKSHDNNYSVKKTKEMLEKYLLIISSYSGNYCDTGGGATQRLKREQLRKALR
jgi:hypothetical protein